jgi:hypothetical protein
MRRRNCLLGSRRGHQDLTEVETSSHRLSGNGPLRLGQRNVAADRKPSPLSPRHRFVIALHSSDGFLWETEWLFLQLRNLYSDVTGQLRKLNERG